MSVLITDIDASLEDSLLSFEELLLPHVEPVATSVIVWHQVLELLDLEHNTDSKLVELGKLLLLEVSDLLLGLSQVLINRLLLCLHLLLVGLELVDIKLDSLLLIIEVET